MAGLNPGTMISYGNDDDYIIPAQMFEWPTGAREQVNPMVTWPDQYNNIAQGGTNLLLPVLDKPAGTSYQYNLPSGGYIRVVSNGDGSYNYQFTSAGGSGVSGNNLQTTWLAITYDPFTDGFDSNTQFGVLYHTTSGWLLDTYKIPTLQDVFIGTETEEIEDSLKPDGGFPMMDVESDEIPFPSLPSINFLDTHMITMYCPSETDLQGLANYLWSGNFITDFVKLSSNPMDAIVNLSILPVTPSTTTHNIIIGNANSGVSSSMVTQQYYYIDFGTINVDTYFSTFYDWNPYTKAEIYLPFIGTRQLDIDEIMGSELWLQYMVDVLTGNCCAMLRVQRVNGNSARENLKGILYHWNGNMCAQGCLSGQDFTQQIKATISTVLGGAALVGGLAVAPEITAPLAVAGAAASAGSAANVITTPTPVEHAGSLGGNTGMLGVQSAYVILSRPNIAIPSTIRHDEGLKSCISSTIGNLSGFVKMKEVHVDGLQCTDAEKREIENILKSGILC